MSLLNYTKTIAVGVKFSASILVSMFQDAARAINNLGAENVTNRTLTGIKVATSTLDQRVLKRNGFTADRLVAHSLTASNFLKVGEDSGLDADKVRGFHAGDIGTLAVASKVVNKADLTEYGTGWYAGYKRLTFTLADLDLTALPDPAVEPWMVDVSLSAMPMQTLGEYVDQDAAGILAAPRAGGCYVENESTTGFDVVLIAALGQQFWTPNGFVDTVTVTASVLRRAGQTV